MSRSATYTWLETAAFRWAWLGRIEYTEAEQLQRELQQQRQQQNIADTILLLEHPPTYTLGRSADTHDILWTQQQCMQRSIQIIRTDRGGKVTYHGPGQLVAYLIVDLRARSLTVPRFVCQVEAAAQEILAQYEIKTERRPPNAGLWSAHGKIVSVGFHISRGISRHGLALNVAPTLEHFSGIIPCGIPGPVSSMQREGVNIAVTDLVEPMVKALAKTLSVNP